MHFVYTQLWHSALLLEPSWSGMIQSVLCVAYGLFGCCVSERMTFRNCVEWNMTEWLYERNWEKDEEGKAADFKIAWQWYECYQWYSSAPGTAGVCLFFVKPPDSCYLISTITHIQVDHSCPPFYEPTLWTTFVQSVTLLNCMWEESGSTPGRCISFPDKRSPWSFSYH